VTSITLEPEVLAIDHELADTATSVRFLLDVTPDNLIESRRRFLADGSPPMFTYGPLEDDLAVIEARLDAIDIGSVDDPALSQLFQAKRREFELQLAMLRRRGDESFLALSIELYGTVSPTLLAEAEVILSQVVPPPPEGRRYLDAEGFARRVQDELDLYRAVHPDMGATVEVRADSSGIMVSNGNVLISPLARVSEERVHALLQHEVGTHVVTHVNGSHQPLRLLGAGLAGYDETQEGLAVFAEYLAGGLTRRRLRQLAARVIAVHQMIEGKTFAEVHATLVAGGVGAVEAFTIAMRVFRSGGLTKDAVYLRGLRGVISHLGSGGGLDVLWLGKMALADTPLVEDLRHRGLLRDPVLIPRYVADPGAGERLEAVNATTTPFDLIGAT